MNSKFRRDYTYTITGKNVFRYLRHDKETDKFIFLQGVTYKKDEVKVYIPACNYKVLDLIKKVDWIGYKPTDNYTKIPSKLLVKAMNKLSYYNAGSGDSYIRETDSRLRAVKDLRICVSKFLVHNSHQDLMNIYARHGGLILRSHLFYGKGY